MYVFNFERRALKSQTDSFVAILLSVCTASLATTEFSRLVLFDSGDIDSDTVISTGGRALFSSGGFTAASSASLTKIS